MIINKREANGCINLGCELYEEPNGFQNEFVIRFLLKAMPGDKLMFEGNYSDTLKYVN